MLFLTVILLFAGISSAAQCTNDACLQTLQEFGSIGKAYCVLYSEIEGFAAPPGFLKPWANQPASISSACSCLTATTALSKSSTKSSSILTPTTSKCVATPTTIVSISTVISQLILTTTVLSTVVQSRTVISTITQSASTFTVVSYSTITAPASTVTSNIPTTITDYSTIVAPASTITAPASTIISNIPTTITDYSTITAPGSTVTSNIPITVTDYSTSIVTDTITIIVLSSSSSASQISSSSSSSATQISPNSSSSFSGSTTSVSTSISVTSSSVLSSASSPTSITATSTPCTCTAYSQIAPAVAACTNIILQDISVPSNSSINLAGLKAGSVVTFAGITTFAYTNSSNFDPITVGGAGVTIQGAPGSILDGNGQAYWDGLGSNGGVPKPNHFIVVSKMTGNSVIKNLYIQNYPVHCFSISGCSNLVITNIQLNNTAGTAPNAVSGGLAAAHNTDGFDISSTTNMVLSNSVVNNQDDCVAVTSGNNILVTGMYCNGGHGLSIGSVGGKSNNNVTGVIFNNSIVTNSENGARIKSNYNTTGFISNITYSNIVLSGISKYGIDIQQDYLNGGPTGNPSNGVIISNLKFSNVTGTAISGARDYYILCGSGSCSGFTFTDVSIIGGSVTDSCNYPPSGCPGSPGTTSTISIPPSSTTSSSPSTSLSSTITSSSSVSSPSSTPPAWQRISPAPGAVVVDTTGIAPGSYLTLQSGVNALSLTSTTPQNLFIYPGTYTEQVYIPALKSNLTVQGYTLDGSSYAGNTATVTYNLALLNTTSDDLTATIRQWNPNTKFYNLNIANTFGHVSKNGQNLALSAHTGNQGYYGVQLWGYQDTLLANTGHQLYSKSLIVGAIDFIFGQTATAWFDQVDIRTIATGCVTASGRADATNPSWYVINNSTVAGLNSSIGAGISYLGRPWQSFARVVFQNTELSNVIAPAGWRPWSTAVNGTTNTQNVTFAEYNNYGAGSILEEGPRADFSEQMTASIAIETVLGDGWTHEWWVDQTFMV